MSVLSQDENRHLLELKEDVSRKKKLERSIERESRRLEELRSRCRMLEDQLKKENLDVQKLEQIKFSTIAARIFHLYEGQLKKETQEALEAQFRCQQAQEEYREAQAELQIWRKELEQYGGVEEQFEELYAQKRRSLLAQKGEEGARLLALTEQRDQLANQYQETVEAYHAANDLLNVLHDARALLEYWMYQRENGFWLSELRSTQSSQRLDRVQEYLRQIREGLRHLYRQAEDLQESYRPKDILEEIRQMEESCCQGALVNRLAKDDAHLLHEALDEMQTKISLLASQLFGQREHMNGLLADMDNQIDKIVLGPQEASPRDAEVLKNR